MKILGLKYIIFAKKQLKDATISIYVGGEERPALAQR